MQYGNQIGLFKYPKVTNDVITFEHVSEHLASVIAKALYIPCAKIEVGKRNGRIGSMSYLVTDYPKEMLLEGLRFILMFHSNYDKDHLKDNDTNARYSIGMVLNVIDRLANYFNQSSHEFKLAFVKMLTLDFLIGNSDRHHSNWAFIVDKKNILRFAPLYDNGSSLCAFDNESKLSEILRDKIRFEAICTTKSRSMFYGENGKRLTHQETFVELFEKYHFPTTYPERACNILTSDKIDNILSEYKNVYSKERIELISKFLKRKVELLRELCERGKKMKNEICVYRKNLEHLRVFIGTISVSEGRYTFSYSEEFKESNESKEQPLIPFLDIDKVYTSEKLFPVFSSRLPDRKRKDIEQILKKYEMDYYDEFTLLQRSKGRLPIDLLEFIEPLDVEEVDGAEMEVAGVSHYAACNKKEKHLLVEVGDQLQLSFEPENQYDSSAIMLKYNNEQIGYVPVYYNKVIGQLMNDEKKIEAEVLDIKCCECDEPDSVYCCDCIKIKLHIQ